MGTIAPSASQAVRPRQAQSAQAGRMRATICKRGFDNSRNTFTQQQFSLARHCQQAQPLLREASVCVSVSTGADPRVPSTCRPY
jgi:hypothetical protein